MCRVTNPFFMPELCVCAESLTNRGKYPCGHELCLSCTLKKRVLMKDLQCPYCRSSAQTVSVVSSSETDPSVAKQDFQPGQLKVEMKKLAEMLRHILNYACPECDVELKTYKALKAHIQTEHGKALCDVCTRHEYVFSDEYQLLAPGKVKKHLKKKHIYCRYCQNYHYGPAEFSKHCRQHHMGCPVCERNDPEHPLYFRTYDQLEKHYLEKHYRCLVSACLEDKHIVFGTEIELQKHIVEAHRGLLSNVRQAQTVDLGQLSRDTEWLEPEQPAPERETSVEKYKARLQIAAGHDESKIERLEAANATFIEKNVPVAIFIATYESVLLTTPKAEVTALLSAFRKSHSEQLSESTRRALELALAHRSQAEDVPKNPPASSSILSSITLEKKKKPSVPAPVDVQRINWGLKVPTSGGINNVAQLPRLGGSSYQSQSSQKLWQPKISAQPTLGRNVLVLPKLPKKDESNTRQTVTPSLDMFSSQGYNRPSFANPNISAPSSVSSTPRASTLSSSAASSRNNSRSALNNLPTLAKQRTPEEPKKKRGIIRMV